ncbi:predicted protein [Verticillium alfalfae VaMs.102]|uniref:Predicted protein n=1 Tax=Verticillium alfalfae (strain VaMs.102 / ATCC MYA-4576 / FGSC 10136) TaxID=526221 RepID=C9SY86_VERA1|nr:predicted protein [Verticillium alfalfae VaMs.102]EEY23751.1 predicted protein [Verticillium alfalfae VaMs.102]
MEPQTEASSPIAHLGQSPLTEIGQCLDPIETRLQWAKQAVDAGHDVNELDLNTDWRRNKGRPLHSALEHPGRMDEMTAHDRGRNESLDLVKFLLERGADPRLRDCRGKETAMDRARCVLGSPVGDVERSFVEEAVRLMEEAAQKMEQKETTSKGFLGDLKGLLGLGGQKRETECLFCREEKSHNWHYNVYVGTTREHRMLEETDNIRKPQPE